MRSVLTSRVARTLPILWVMGVLCMVLLCTKSTCYAADDAVESGRKALEKSGNYPWYDEQSDDLRRLNEKKKKKDPDQPTSSRQDSGGGAVSSAFNAITWIIFSVLLVALLVFIIWAIINRETDPRDSTKKVEEKELEDRIEQLPLDIDPSKHDLLTAAEQEYNQGNYSKAIVYLFSYQLVELDKNQLIRLLKGKTNRQYLIELRSFNNLSNILATTIRYFEDAFFGKYEITKAQFEECWKQVDQFHQLVNQQPQS